MAKWNENNKGRDKMCMTGSNPTHINQGDLNILGEWTESKTLFICYCSLLAIILLWLTESIYTHVVIIALLQGFHWLSLSYCLSIIIKTLYDCSVNHDLCGHSYETLFYKKAHCYSWSNQHLAQSSHRQNNYTYWFWVAMWQWFESGYLDEEACDIVSIKKRIGIRSKKTSLITKHDSLEFQHILKCCTSSTSEIR